MEEIRKINKLDLAKISIARDLIVLNISDKLKPVIQYSKELQMSVGIIQKAIEDLEIEKVALFENRGVQGKIIKYKDQQKIIQFANIKMLIGVMPLPYSKRYEGIATAIKTCFENYGIKFYFAYMPGSKIRLEMVEKGIYDFAITSKLAYLKNNNDKLSMAMEFGKNSYVSDHVILKRKGLSKKNLKVGIDKNSEDQYYLSKSIFKDGEFEFIDVNSDNIVKDILSKK